MPSPQTSHCSRPRRLPHPACSTASQAAQCSRHVHTCSRAQAAQRRSRHIQRARQRRSSRAQAAQRSPPGVQRPRHHRVARVASHRELVRRNRQRPVRCRHRKLPTVHVHVACHIQRARQRRSSGCSMFTSSVLDSVAAPELRLLNVVAPVTSSVLDSVAAPELRLLNVVAPVTSSVLDSVPATNRCHMPTVVANVVAPVTSSPPPPCCPCRRNRQRPVRCRHRKLPTVHVHVACHIQRARQRRSSRAPAQRSRSRHVQRPRHHRVARVASHRELVRRNRQRPVRCRHRKLPTVHVHVACHIQRARQRRGSRAQAAQRSLPSHPACSTASLKASTSLRHVQRPRHHRVARVASHRELVCLDCQGPIRS